MNNELAGLTDSMIYQLSRARSGTITRTIFSSQSINKTFSALVRSGLLAESASPKGRKRYYDLTDAGKALLPAIDEYYAIRERELQATQARESAARFLEDAAPALIEAAEELIRICDNTDDDAAFALDQLRAAIAKAKGEA